MGFYNKLLLITIINSHNNYYLSISIILSSIIILIKYLHLIQNICLKFNCHINQKILYTNTDIYIISSIIIFLIIGFTKYHMEN